MTELPVAQPTPHAGVVMDAQSFAQISKIAYEDAGLAISDSKSAMVRTRLARRLRALNLASFKDYCSFIQTNDGAEERRELISALTTNVSHFFREKHHFEMLTEQAIPEIISGNGARSLRAWSAGCSNGQEPYTLAVTLYEAGFLDKINDVKILASDIDPKVVSFGHEGQYPEHMMDGMNLELRTKYFSQVAGEHGETNWRASPELKKLISFRKLNLINDWPMRSKFDVIFCRNVIIYFDQATQDMLWEKFARILNPGGWLFVGHSERVSDAFQDYFEVLGGTAYRRK